MPGAAVVATALTFGSPARIKSLTIDGLDVLRQPGNGTARYGTPLESVTLTEAGPNGVSTLSFRIDDPLAVISINDGDEVLFHDIVNSDRLFGGYVSHWDIIPDFGYQGRTFVVECVGYDALLDWALVTNHVIPAGTAIADAIQSLVGNAIGTGPLRAAAGPVVTLSTQATPVEAQGSVIIGPLTFAQSTLREAILAVFAAVAPTAAIEWFLAVDAWAGVRVWTTTEATFGAPTDYQALVIADTSAGTAQSEAMDYEIDATGIVRGVWIVGTGFNLMVTDGSGKPGRYVSIEDDTIDTTDKAYAAGAAYLAQFRIGARGQLQKQDVTAGTYADVHAGSKITITSVKVVGTAAVFRIAAMTRTYSSGGAKESVRFDFGGQRPSLAKLTRRLTRSTLS